MRSRIAAGLVLLLSAAVPPASADTRSPAMPELKAVYDFYFGGLWAAEMKIKAAFGPEGYQAGAEFRTKGIVGFFADTHLRVETVGRIDAEGLTPVRFRSKEREEKDEQFVEISFSKDGPPSVIAAPAFKKKPWSIEPRDQQDATDPLSAVLIALTPAPADEVCGRRIEAYDGKRRFAFEIEPPRRDGDRIRCDGAYLRLAGFKPKTVRKRGRQPFKLYLKQRGDGAFQVVRLVSKTKYGKAVMRLRD